MSISPDCNYRGDAMSITNKLNQIKNAIYGKEVRGAIHDAIKQVYDDASVNHDNANMEVKMARGTHNTLNGLAAGVAVAWWAHSWTLLVTYILIPGLLWFYSASYKRMFLVGNLVVSFASAIVPVLVAIVNADYLRYLYQETLAYTPIVGELYVWTGGFAAFAFLLTWAREMVKDIEDVEGDREMECRTLPIVWGEKAAKIFVTVLLVVIAALIAYMLFAVLPFSHEWKSLPTRYVVFGLMVPILCSIVLLWAANNRTELHRVQTIIKFIMFMGVLFSFVIATNLTA